MRFANVRELKNKTLEILKLAEKEEVVVTSRGKPSAIIRGITEEDFEDYLLENNPKFRDCLREGEKRIFGTRWCQHRRISKEEKVEASTSCEIGSFTSRFSGLGWIWKWEWLPRFFRNALTPQY